jgi:hypothetical protein
MHKNHKSCGVEKLERLNKMALAMIVSSGYGVEQNPTNAKRQSD